MVATAQLAKTSTWEPTTSLAFNEYFEPFPRFETAQGCRDACIAHARCTGWTYYHDSFVADKPEDNSLRRACILGAGLKDRRSDKPGRTSGVVSSR